MAGKEERTLVKGTLLPEGNKSKNTKAGPEQQAKNSVARGRGREVSSLILGKGKAQSH